jgi:hypothetical protein
MTPCRLNKKNGKERVNNLVVKRRNVLIGLRSLMTGSGAMLGTGAFGSVRAERSVSVNTAGDANALLRIEPTDQGKAVITDNSDTGPLTIDLGVKRGFNQSALTTISPLLHITNTAADKSSTRVKLTSESPDTTEAYDGIGYAISKDPRAVMTFFVGPQDPPELESTYDPRADNGYVNGRFVNDEGRNGVEIEKNDSTVVSVIVDTRNIVSDSTRDLAAYDSSITIIAD